jgi:nucleoside-diphosphate-sugar epimerase
VSGAARRCVDCFVATSSASLALGPFDLFAPSGGQLRNFVQIMPTAEPSAEQVTCYAKTKAIMEKLVLTACAPDFRTGCIRPGHVIYGHGTGGVNSASWDNLTHQRGPS